MRRASSRGIWIAVRRQSSGASRVPRDRVLVVKALRAHRLADPRVVFLVDGAARETGGRAGRSPRRAWAGSAAARPSGPTPPGVDGSEARSGQRREHRGMLGDGVRDALAAPQAGGDELVGVAAVGPRAGRADGFTAIAAALQQRLIRLTDGGERGSHLSGRGVDGVDAAAQPDRPAAVAGGPQLAIKALPLLGVRSALEDVGDERPGRVGRPAVMARPRAEWSGCWRARRRRVGRRRARRSRGPGRRRGRSP